MVRKPRALRTGDLIEIVSPASPIRPEKAESAVAMLHAAGYRTRFAPHAFDANAHLAGTDADRAADLMAAFRDPEVAAVYCSRGGYGCGRLMPLLDFDLIAESGKMLIGFSDITVIHLALQRRGVVSMYAPMALTLSVEREPWVRESFLSMISGGNPIVSSAPTGECVVGGVAEGALVGGCLCLLTDSIGTPEPLETEGKVLLIEDVDEHPHRVDAMLTHLLNSGLAQAAAGFVVGEMTGTDERVDPGIGGKGWREIVTERLAPLGKPMIVNFPCGHMKGMLSLPLGVRVRLDADAGRLSYVEAHLA
ncbi:MAG: LD-carboxypeptidase [Fimbriimonadales bacterium]